MYRWFLLSILLVSPFVHADPNYSNPNFPPRVEVVTDISGNYRSLDISGVLVHATIESLKPSRLEYLRSQVSLQIQYQGSFKLIRRSDISQDNGDFLANVTYKLNERKAEIKKPANYDPKLDYVPFTIHIDNTDPNGEGVFKELVDGGAFTIRVLWRPVSSTEKSEFTLNLDGSFPFDIPDGAHIVPTYRAFTVAWSHKPAIEFTLDGKEAVETKKSPPKTVILNVFPAEDRTFNSLNLVEGSAGGACELSLTSEATCDVDCGVGEFPQFAAHGIAPVRVEAEDSKSMQDLTPFKPYAVILSYENALKWQCLIGVPGINYSVAELNGAEDASLEDLRCFIATAAYGSPLHPKLKSLRAFRDHVLLSHPLGRRFVAAYYRYSPVPARWIAEHETLRAAARFFLKPLIYLAEYLELEQRWTR